MLCTWKQPQPMAFTWHEGPTHTAAQGTICALAAGAAHLWFHDGRRARRITCCRSKRRPIQPAPFKYDEEALKYYDFFMSECARVMCEP